MEQVLSIDLSTEPAHVVLTSVSENKIEIIQHRSFALAQEITIDSLLNRTITTPQTNSPEGPTTLAESQDNSNDAIIEITDIDGSTLTLLKNVLQEFPQTWTNSVVIVPMLDYLSLNVSLPFADAKNINKIVDLEVQDIVPFEVDEFVVEGHSVFPISASQFDVHVSLVPKKFIRNILTLCRASGLEPSIITTPCGSLAALPLAAPDYFQGTFALISVTDAATYLTIAIDGVIRADKVIPISTDSPTGITAVIGQLKVTFLALENKHNKQFAKVFVHANQRVIGDFQQLLGRAIEVIDLAEFVSGAVTPEVKKAAAQAALTTIFVCGEKPAIPLTNFRVREFSFRPNWGALIQSLLSIRHYFLALIALVIFSLFAVFQLRQLQISRIQSAVREQIRVVVPNLKGGDGNEIPAFLGELSTLGKELESLGSSHEISPTNILVELTKDLAEQKDITINQIDIRPDRVILDISVPDYAAADRVERILRRKKDLYRRIRKDANSYASASGGRNFNFELKLVD